MSVWKASVGALVTVLSVPLIFFAITDAWRRVHESLGNREVSDFIDSHQDLVSTRLKDPRVHSFSLTHDSQDTSTLVVRFDVDDKATYEMLESDLRGMSGLRFPPRFETNIRSKEELGDNLAYGMWGAWMIGEGAVCLICAISMSFGIPLLVWLIVLIRVTLRVRRQVRNASLPAATG